jgi:glycosyltransferase involved in cell wall biosynthesis
MICTVIVPTRNGADLLRECLDALRAQTYRDFETIVVDDASTDCTGDLLKGYPDVRVVRLPGREGHGFVMAANTGIRRARDVSRPRGASRSRMGFTLGC